MFYFDNFKGQRVLKSDMLESVTAFFSLRNFNLDVLKNNNGRVLTPNQTHSDNVEFVSDKNEYPECDGLILDNTKDTIYLRFADCTPLIFYDRENKIGAVSHAGWRGTAAKIGVKTIERMAGKYGTKPENVIALIGPTISVCCYEVGEEVKEKLLSTVKNTDGLYKNMNVDLKKINSRQFEEIGVQNIDICPYCTSCNNDLFYSYRKENGTKSRHYAVLRLF